MMTTEKIGFIGPFRALFLGYSALFLLIAGLGSWSVLTTLRGAVIASGQVVVEGRQHVVEHVDGGNLREIFVSEGDLVSPGDLLLKLEDRDLRSALAHIDRQIFEATARKARLIAERDGLEKIEISNEILNTIEAEPTYADQLTGQANLFEARKAARGAEKKQLENRSRQLDAQIEKANVELAASEGQLALIDTSLERKQILLGKGVVTEQAVLDIQTHRAGLLATYARADRQVIALQGEAEDTAASIQMLHATFREEVISELRDLEVKEAELHEERDLLMEKVERTEVRAPIGGIVNGLAVLGHGDVLQPAEPVLYVVPQNEPMAILARVADLDEPDVYTGQEVSLQFLSLSHNEGPEILGRLEHKSADVFEDPSSGQRYFEVEITVPPTALKILGQPIKPGMPVDGFIRTSDRTPMDYLLEPVLRVVSRVAID